MKQYLKTDPIRFFINCADAAVIRLRTGLRNCQSNAVAAFFPGAGFISSAETLKQSFRCYPGKFRTDIFHPQHRFESPSVIFTPQ